MGIVGGMDIPRTEGRRGENPDCPGPALRSKSTRSWWRPPTGAKRGTNEHMEEAPLFLQTPDWVLCLKNERAGRETLKKGFLRGFSTSGLPRFRPMRKSIYMMVSYFCRFITPKISATIIFAYWQRVILPLGWVTCIDTITLLLNKLLNKIISGVLSNSTSNYNSNSNYPDWVYFILFVTYDWR